MKKLQPSIKILDWYLIKKFIGTYLFALLIIIGVVIIFDISEKIDKFAANEVPLKEIIVDYYFNFIPFISNMFSPLFVFITVIFFTSKLASNSEIIAMLSGGISFHRMMLPYMISAGVIALISFLLGLYVIPPANAGRLTFERKYIKKATNYNSSQDTHYQISPGTFVYVESFSRWNNTAYRFTLESIEDNKITSKLTAETAGWDKEMKGWKLSNWFLREYDEHGIETVTTGRFKDTVISLTLDDFYRLKNDVQTMDVNELNDLIATQKVRGDDMIKYSLIEKHTRIATPFSAFILTIMGVSLSSRKRRGGIGLNIGVGVGLAFTYILFMRFSQMFVYTGSMPVWLAIWIPNILYAIIAAITYRMAPK